MGYAMALAGMHEGKYVTYLPSYGAEVRGGAANCTVSIGDEEIASPIASEPEFIVVMNTPSMIRYQNSLKARGDFFINSSLVDDIPSRRDISIHTVPASRLAEELGEIRAANMVMLGAFVRKSGLVKLKTLIGLLQEIFPHGKKKLLDLNQQALYAGFNVFNINQKSSQEPGVIVDRNVPQ